jgi:predicted nucleic acid-binding protein
MSDFLLDTNLISELRRRDRSNPGVRQWFNAIDDDQLFLSVITLGEIRKGIERLRPRAPAQAVVLERWLSTLEKSFSERLLPIDKPTADQWGKIQAIRPLPEIDALIAAACLQNDLTLVTRIDADFSGIGIRVLDPFS